MGKSTRNEVKEASFFFQCNGDQYKYKFDLLTFVVHKDYHHQKDLFRGTDIGLAAFKIDRSAPGFDPEEFSQLRIPQISFLKPEELEGLKETQVRVVGYPIETYDPASGAMEPNSHRLYQDEGALGGIKLREDGFGAIALYSYDQVVTGQG